MTHRALVVVLLLSCSSFSAIGADKPGKKAYLTPEAAGPDFAVQGEYTGKIGAGAKVGAQVVANGKGKFDVVLYPKGLPGDGWGGKSKVRLKGETKDGKVVLSGRNFSGQIKDGVLTGTAEENVKYELKHIVRKSPTLGAKPPEGATVLFDGSNVDAWNGMKIEEGHLLGVGGRTKKSFANFKLHLEFRTPFMPEQHGQARGNSGMYLGDQYECQILDSFGLEGEDNECGGIYHVSRPELNMCFPPLSWQTYDIDFTAARFDAEGKKVAPARATIRLNGVVIHDNRELVVTPGGGRADEKPGPLYLQNHGNPVRFRNIWIVEKK